MGNISARRLHPGRAIVAIVALTVGLLSAGGLAGTTSATAATGLIQVQAANLNNFRPGNIINDAMFFDSSTMTESQIQAFLGQRVPQCQSGYTCLKDWWDTSRAVPADAMCGRYDGGWRERASTIIYKVAKACGINPQVILATLEKEQSLVSHTWPSDWRYEKAMGQGCPDTAGCDVRYTGFFNQVYGAAWQFKRYANPQGTSSYFTWYAPGRTWDVLYNPNRGCGSSPVYIENQATSNLYYFTPYQPNAASLRAGYGEGDGCSAYGNRNFFHFFTDWFGSTQTRDAAAAGRIGIWGAHYDLGGDTGSLGRSSGTIRCGLSSDACYQDFQNGVIYASSAGAYAITGTVRSTWIANDYERGLGYPTGPAHCGLSGNACYQDFQNGVIYASSAGAFAITGPTRTTWNANDYERGLGYPTAAARCGLVNDGCYQDFQNGVIYSTSWGTYAITGAARDVWMANDFERGLGYPTSAYRCGLAGGGCYQDFQNGVIYTSSTGTYAISGAIRTAWNANDFERGLGYPTKAIVCGLSDGGCYQDFQRGVVYSSSAGAFAITGATRDVWMTNDFERGLGYPTTAYRCGLAGGGCVQEFQNGAVATPQGGRATAVRDSIWTAWSAAGKWEGRYGYPTGDRTCSGSQCSQPFTGGTITASR